MCPYGSRFTSIKRHEVGFGLLFNCQTSQDCIGRDDMFPRCIQGSSSNSESTSSQISFLNVLKAKNISSSGEPSWVEDNALKFLPSETLWKALRASLACFQFGMQQAQCRHDATGFPGLKQGFTTLQTECYDLPMICSTSPKQSLDQLFVDSFSEFRFANSCRYLQILFRHFLSAPQSVIYSRLQVPKRLLRHFTQLVLRCDSEEMMDDLSGLGLRHVGLI